MKKVVLTVLAAFAIVLFIASCEPENDTTAEELRQIDNDEPKDSDI